MKTTLPGRWDLTNEDAALLQSLGVGDPFFDAIPDTVFEELEKLAQQARTDIGRAEIEELYEKLIMSAQPA